MTSSRRCNSHKRQSRKLPDDPHVSDTLRCIYYKKGLTDLAVNTLRQAADHAPSNPSVHYHLGVAQLKRGDKTAARQSIEGALKLNPAFPSADEAKPILNTIKEWLAVIRAATQRRFSSIRCAAMKLPIRTTTRQAPSPAAVPVRGRWRS